MKLPPLPARTVQPPEYNDSHWKRFLKTGSAEDAAADEAELKRFHSAWEKARLARYAKQGVVLGPELRGGPADAPRNDDEDRDVLAASFAVLEKVQRQSEEMAKAFAQMAHIQAEGLQQLARLADTMSRPRTREGVVETPDGPLKMTITERRETQ
jgi:hypothetical protein